MSKRRKKNQRKRTNKVKRKRNRKIALFSMCFVILCLVILLLYLYQKEYLTEEHPAKKPDTEIQAPVKKPGREQLPPQKEKQSKQRSPGKGTAPAPVTNSGEKTPVVPRITSYIDLEYPVSYSARPEQLIFHTGHTVSYNANWKLPNWVSYELTREETVGTEKRYNKFIPDPHIKGQTASNADYRSSGYDKGHMVPAADMKWSSTAMKESFYFTNICPQNPNLNQKSWKKLEDKVRDWAMSDSAIIVICGPIVNNRTETIGSNKVVVPNGFFKVVLSPYIDSPRSVGFLFKNEPSGKPLRSHAVSVDSVEAVTGLDFFSPLPDETEDVLERFVDTLYWGL